MDKQTIEGVEYYQADQVEGLIRSRLAKVSERARTAETQLEELEGQLGEAQGKVGVSDTLAARVAELEESLSSAHGKYDRHTAISGQGFTDPDVRDLIEWAYDRASAGAENGDHPDLEPWLSGLREDPSSAPAALRPHLAALLDSSPSSPEAAPPAPGSPRSPARTPIPKSTQGLQPAPGGNVTIDQALMLAQRGDLSAYKQVREGLRSKYSRASPLGGGRKTE